MLISYNKYQINLQIYLLIVSCHQDWNQLIYPRSRNATVNTLVYFQVMINLINLATDARKCKSIYSPPLSAFSSDFRIGAKKYSLNRVFLGRFQGNSLLL